MKIQLWKEILDPYEKAVTELIAKFRSLQKEYERKNLYCPIERISGRVKEVSSILEKMHRKNIPFERMEEEIEDIAGVRLITQFEEDVEKLGEQILSRSDLTPVVRKDYLKNQKESGYRSLHLIVRYRIDTLDGPKDVNVEIQIRTMAMNFWATAEHSLQYKYRQELPPYVAEQLARAAEATAELDSKMNAVRAEIMDAEIHSRIESNLVKDILQNIEGLYELDNEREAEKIQNEFYQIYRKNDLSELKRFHDNLDRLAEDYHIQNVETDKHG